MKKILINNEEGFIKPYPEKPSKKDEKDTELFSCIGVHEFCEGWIDKTKVSKEYQALHCRRCNLRILTPLSVDTWLKLNEHCKKERKNKR